MKTLNSELISATTSMIQRVGIDTGTPASSPDAAVWTALTEAGFQSIGIPEANGGSGGTLADALAVVSAASETGALTALIEHTALAAWLAARCGWSLDTRTMTVAIADHRCTVRAIGDRRVLDGRLDAVAHGHDADLLVVLFDSPLASERPSIAVISLTASGITVDEGTDLVGASIDDYEFDATPIEFHAESPIGADDLRQRGALAYAVALTAAARAVRDQTLRYAGERIQFGRHLTEFQAIQQRLASMAALTALMESATDTAVAATSASTDPHNARRAIAAAKVVTSSSAREIAAIGHQIHGAIGFTSEHRLGRFTTSLWTWRDRYGSERYWADVLAGQILEGGADLWDLVVGGEQAEGNH
ncbi:acyl-CoA dehydrogenase family protein [Nocardia sp. NPDC005366]|uniref:acyl-CoA dehydrogenase family protein n=1 Tax=Nocardia sp. NPDC005366 TaxID=3156878 RepID=UPI0033BAC759